MSASAAAAIPRLRSDADRDFCGFACFASRTYGFDFHACHALAVHLLNRKAQLAVSKTLAALGNKSQLVQHEAPYRGVCGVFRKSNIILAIQVSHIQSRIEN